MTIDEQHEFHVTRDDLADCDGSQHSDKGTAGRQVGRSVCVMRE